MLYTDRRAGFTLLEFITAAGILVVAISVAVVLLNPTELFKQARDVQRIVDLETLSSTVELMQANHKNIGTSGQVVYISLQSATSDCADIISQLQSLNIGWSFHCSVDDPTLVNGDGWLPFDMSIDDSRTPVTHLPLDPRNGATGQRYYMYIKGGRGFEFIGIFESQRYIGERAAKDGGSDNVRYETGPNLLLWDEAQPDVTS